MTSVPVSQRYSQHKLMWLLIDVPVKDLGVVAILAPFLIYPDDVPLATRRGVATARAALFSPRCPVCHGARYKRSPRIRAEHAANPREAVWRPFVQHRSDCPASDPELVAFLAATRPKR